MQLSIIEQRHSLDCAKHPSQNLGAAENYSPIRMFVPTERAPNVSTFGRLKHSFTNLK